MPATRKSGNNTDTHDLAKRGSKGDILFREGETSHDLFIVEEGEVELLKKIGGKHRRLSLVEAGGFFGEHELLDQTNRDTSARAVTDFKVLQISPDIFEQMIRDQPDIAVYMLRKLSRELREKLEKKAAARVEEEKAAPPKKKEASDEKKSAAAAKPKESAKADKPKASASEASSGGKQKSKAKEGTKPPKKSKGSKGDKGKASKSGAVKVKSKSKQKKSSDDAFTPLVPLEDKKKSTEAPSGEPRLELESTGKTYPLVVDGESSIGRIDRSTGKSPDVDFTSLDESRTISRRHARIFAETGNYFVEERKGAHNGTFVNGKRLKSGESRRLKHLDKLQFGHVKTIFKT